ILAPLKVLPKRPGRLWLFSASVIPSPEGSLSWLGWQIYPGSPFSRMATLPSRLPASGGRSFSSDMQPSQTEYPQNLSSRPERPDFFIRADLWRVGQRSGGISLPLQG